MDELLGDTDLAQRALQALPPELGTAFSALAEQSIYSGIDYASLGLNWDHPQTRLAYRDADGPSFRKAASRARQARSQAHLQAVAQQLSSTTDAAEQGRLLVGAFCTEIGAPATAPNATVAGVTAALEGAPACRPHVPHTAALGPAPVATELVHHAPSAGT